MSNQLAFSGAPSEDGGLGYRRPGHARRRGFMTSLELSYEQRELLRDLARERDDTMAEILREGLRLYAEAHGQSFPEEAAAS